MYHCYTKGFRNTTADKFDDFEWSANFFIKIPVPDRSRMYAIANIGTCIKL